MTDDVGMHHMIAVTVFLCAGLCASILGVTILSLNYLQNYSETFVWSVSEMTDKALISAFADSKRSPMSGGLVYKLLNDAGLTFRTIEEYDLDGNLSRAIAITDADYSEFKAIEFVTEFAKGDKLVAYYEGELSFDYGSNLYTVKVWEVDLIE